MTRALLPALRTSANAVAALASTCRQRARRRSRHDWESLRLQWTVELMRREWRLLAQMDLAVVRRRLDRDEYGALGAVTVVNASIGGRRALWFLPRTAEPPEGLLLFLHGGGFTFGSARSHATVAAALAVHAGLPTLGIDYRLAPEHPFPAALTDVHAAFAAVLEEVPPGRTAVAGTSAGGNLAAGLLVALRDEGLPLPSSAVLLSPWLDLDVTRLSPDLCSRDYQSLAMLARQAAVYCGATSPAHPFVSPLRAALGGLAPIYVQVGEYELFLQSCACFAARAREAGTTVQMAVRRRMPHAPEFFAELAKEGRMAVAEPAMFLRSTLARQPAHQSLGAAIERLIRRTTLREREPLTSL